MKFTQYGNSGKESLVHFPLPDGRSHKYPSIRVPVDAPQFDVRLGFDGSGPGCAIDQRQLAETPAFTDRRYKLVIDVDLVTKTELAL